MKNNNINYQPRNNNPFPRTDESVNTSLDIEWWIHGYII